MRQGKTGPAPKFTPAHVYRALFKIREAEPIGRKRLAGELGIGEGSTRSIISILKASKLVRTRKLGMALTAKGKRIMEDIPLAMAKLDAGDLTIGPVDAAVHIKGGASKVRMGIEQRDEAIKAGAMGATTIVCRAGRLIALEDLDLDKAAREVAKSLRAAFDINDGDAVIVSTAADTGSAENGAIFAALSLLEGLPF